MTTKILAQQAEEWLDATMNKLLQEHDIHEYLRVFRSTNEEMPREETKLQPDSFILDCVQTLILGQNLISFDDGD